MNRKYLTFSLLTAIVISSIFIGIRDPNQTTLKSSGEKIEDKIDPIIHEKLSGSNSLMEKIYVIILLFEGQNLSEIDNLRSLDIIRRFDLVNGFVAHISLDMVYDIAEMEEVEGIWLDRPELGAPNVDMQTQIQQMIETSYTNQFSVNYTEEIGATELWNKGINGSGSVIAILDSGIDLTGQIGGDLDDFDENMETFDAKFVGAVSLVPEEPLYYTDFNGRGTYHAGIACGTGYNNISHKGVAPGANYLNVKVYDSVGLTYWSFLISGIEWSIQHSCDVILFCADIPGIYFDPISLAINKAVERGVVVIVPTGDDGPSYMSITTPGQALGAISVGAYDTDTNLVANFSGRGPGLDFRVGPDLVAPGTNLVGPRSKILTNESLTLLNNLASLLNFAGIGIEIDSDIAFNLPSGVFPTPQYGTPINENYTRSSGTGAAAAVVAGCVALLIQAFPLANPQLIRTALCDTCTPILGDFNTEGCGIVNVSAAYNYLYNYFGDNKFTKIPYSAPLIYTGFVSTSDTANWTDTLNSTEISNVNNYDLNALVSTQLLFDAIVVSNGTEQIDFTQIHLPINQFGFDYGGRVHWLSEFTILREFHQISSINIGEDDYNRFLGILELNGLIATVIVETWNYVATEGPVPQYSDRVNGYKISLKLLNLRENEDISNLRLVSYFRSDLFVNETGLVKYDNTEGLSSILDIGKDDSITFDSSLQTMVVSDQNNNTEYQHSFDHASMGFNSTTHQLDSFKISESISLFSELTVNGTEDGFLDNSTEYDMGIDDPGFVMKWNLTDEYSYGQSLEFSSILTIGLGDSFSNAESSLYEQMHYLNSEVSFFPIQDIIIAKADFIRMAPKDEIYSSKALVLNVGNIKINSSTVVFGANRTTSEGYIEVYSKISSITDFEMQDYHYITQHWTPLEEGIYLTGWASIIPVLVGPGREDNVLNNYLIRNVYIYSKPFYQTILKETFRAYPTKLDLNPMKVHYPGDLGLFNISTFGLLNIPEVTVSIAAPGEKFMKLMWFGPDVISQLFNKTTENSSSFVDFSTQIYTNVMQPYDTVFCLAIGPLFCPPVSINFNITFSSPSLGGIFYSLPVQLVFEEYQGRIFFDGIHNFLSMDPDLSTLSGDVLNVELNQIIDLEERLDYPYANYYDLINLWGSKSTKGATIQTFFPGITLNMSDYVSGFDTLVDGDIEVDDSGSFLDNSFMQQLLGGFSFENDTLSTNTIHHDLLQFYDVLIINDPEIELLDEEIEDIIEWVDNGGTLLVWAENYTENHIASLNKLVVNANLTLSKNSDAVGKTPITAATWNSSGNLFPEFEIGTIILEDPISISLNHSSEGLANSVELLCEEGYFAAAQIGRGNVFISADKDIFSIQGLQRENNSEFADVLLDYALGMIFDIEITPSSSSVQMYDITYFNAEIHNSEEISEQIDEGILFLSAFMYEDSSIVNISFFGFTLPAFVVMPINNSHYSMYYDSNWYNHTGNYFALFIIDHPSIAQEIIFVPFTVISGNPPPDILPYAFPDADYPFWVDMLGIVWIIGMGLMIWYYQNEKWKTRLNIISLKGDLLNQAKTKINEGKSIMKQILQGLKITKDEQEQIRYILQNRKRMRKYMKDLRSFGEKIGEHYD